MNPSAVRRGKKMTKALQSMPNHPHPHPPPMGLKLNTEQAPARKDSNRERKMLTIVDLRDSRGEEVMRAAKKFYRYRPNVPVG